MGKSEVPLIPPSRLETVFSPKGEGSILFNLVSPTVLSMCLCKEMHTVSVE